MRYLGSPVVGQLEWVLDALGGASVSEPAVAARFTASFLSLFPPPQWIEMMDEQSPFLRPFTVTRIEVRGESAKADIDTPVGRMTVACTVDGAGAIELLAITPSGGAGLTPRLPIQFDAGQSAAGAGQRLVVIAGVPGTGKSTLADRLGRELAIPVFAIDWLLGALTPFGGRGFESLLDIGEELLTTLAYRQLGLGQSAILDSPGENLATRTRWESLAAHFGAAHVAIVCSCSDDALHEQRLTSRSRGIPGWHEGGDWQNVRRRRDAFPAWNGPCLEIDARRPVDDNVALALEWLRSR